LRAQLRAVTAEDYENLAKMASRSIARVKCNIPQSSGGRLPPGMVEILLVPAVADALKLGDLSKLHVDQAMADMVEEHLDKYRLLTTTLRIREPSYIGVKVRAEIVPSEYSVPELVLARVVETLRAFINPLSTADTAEIQDDLMGEGWEGWPFGRDLYLAEIFSLIQRVPGVKHVLDVSLSTRPVVPVNMVSPQGEEAPAEEALTPIKQKLIQVSSDTLLCSLDHEVVIANLGGENGSI
jgi:predicted phage baseplate assembly protein